MTMFALLDCNNFYVSCERAFNPRLEGKPVVVLSNNDGCIISRSNEAKLLGIPMGAPFFKWQNFCNSNNVQVFSSNYELYGDMSHRVMNLLEKFCPDIEIYSIDEAFFLLDGFLRQNLLDYLTNVRHKIKAWTGIPLSIGFAQTKTLAKIANRIAKYHTIEHVYDLSDKNLQEKILSQFPLEKIWGIGSQLAARLKKLNIHTAKDLRDTDPTKLRCHFSVVMERIIKELRSISCISLELAHQPRKQIISSRSFSKPVIDLHELEEAISHYATTAAIKLRKQNSTAGAIYVFLQTNIFQENAPQYGNCTSFPFPIPTSDTRYIVRIAKKCLRYIYKQGYKYHKAGVMLLDLLPKTIKQYDMFDQVTQRNESTIKTVDTINEIFGKNTIFYAAEGIERSWQIKFNKRSPRYTTRWHELLQVF